MLARSLVAPPSFIASSRSFLFSHNFRRAKSESQSCVASVRQRTPPDNQTPNMLPTDLGRLSEGGRRRMIRRGRRPPPPGRRRRCRAEGKQRGRGGTAEAHHRRRTASVAAARPLARRAQTERASLLDDDGAVGSGRGLCLFHFWSCAGGGGPAARARAKEGGCVKVCWSFSSIS